MQFLQLLAPPRATLTAYPRGPLQPALVVLVLLLTGDASHGAAVIAQVAARRLCDPRLMGLALFVGG
jgi:hypothetical protein